jgi:hypothetical protein
MEKIINTLFLSEYGYIPKNISLNFFKKHLENTIKDDIGYANKSGDINEKRRIPKYLWKKYISPWWKLPKDIKCKILWLCFGNGLIRYRAYTHLFENIPKEMIPQNFWSVKIAKMMRKSTKFSELKMFEGVSEIVTYRILKNYRCDGECALCRYENSVNFSGWKFYCKKFYNSKGISKFQNGKIIKTWICYYDSRRQIYCLKDNKITKIILKYFGGDILRIHNIECILK